jgi:hypothetical protein
MKKLPVSLCILGLFLVFSCKKSNGDATAAANAYVSSVITYSPQSQLVDSFTYDSSRRLTQFSQLAYDSTSGFPQFATYSVDFAYDGSNTTPSSLTVIDISSGNFGDKHILSFDGQGRIVKDTSLSGSGYVGFYSYPGNNIASVVLFEGTAQNNVIDTLFMTNDNMGEERVYNAQIPGQPDVLDGDIVFGFSSTANPVFHHAISNAIGPLLTNFALNGFGGVTDFNSKNIFDRISGAGPGVPVGFSANYTLTNDGKGRLSKMMGSSGGNYATTVFNYYPF